MSRRTRKRPSASASAPAKLERRSDRRLKTVASIAGLAVVAGYAGVSVAFTAPASAAQDVAQDVFAPYFSQRWDVFAPNLVRVNSALEVQVQWREGEELVHSGWLPVTDVELAASRGIPMPSRIAKSSANALSTYLSRYDDLSTDQQDRVQDTFIEVGDDGEFQQTPDEDLISQLDGLGDSSEVVPFLRYDYMLTRFATAWGEAYYGKPIERVRWRAVFDRPNDFVHRFDDERQYDLNYLTFGWREAWANVDGSIIDIFTDVEQRYGAGPS